jgi:hypothetical protein
VIAIVIRHVLLHPDRAAHGAVDAVENDKQRVPARLNDLPAVLVDRWVDQGVAESPEPLERSRVIQPDQAAVTDHISVNHRDLSAPAEYSPKVAVWNSPLRCVGIRS